MTSDATTLVIASSVALGEMAREALSGDKGEVRVAMAPESLGAALKIQALGRLSAQGAQEVQPGIGAGRAEQGAFAKLAQSLGEAGEVILVISPGLENEAVAAWASHLRGREGAFRGGQGETLVARVTEMTRPGLLSALEAKSPPDFALARLALGRLALDRLFASTISALGRETVAIPPLSRLAAYLLAVVFERREAKLAWRLGETEATRALVDDGAGQATAKAGPPPAIGDGETLWRIGESIRAMSPWPPAHE
ncbi:MAG: hypothetical protein LBU69_00030, partial [Deltaproteobacteria bacterium]|nr:hypothetical protein [Deltaproteobacteria bacterium]